MTDDDLLAGVVAELDALLPVLAEEVTALVAERHGVAVPPDVASVVAVLRDVRDIDDTSVERVVLGALGHHTDGDPMAEKAPSPDPAKEPAEPHIVKDRTEWWRDCPDGAMRMLKFDYDPDFADATDFAVALVQAKQAKPYVAAVAALARFTRNDELERRLVCCDDLTGLARRALCLEEEANAYAGRVDSLVRSAIGARDVGPAWQHMLQHLAVAMDKDSEAAWRRAELAAAQVRRRLACSATLYHRFVVSDLLKTADHCMDTLGLTGIDRLKSAASLTGRDLCDLQDEHQDYAAQQAVLHYTRSGDKTLVRPHEAVIFGAYGGPRPVGLTAS